jgi:hypothetical protein
MVGYAAAKTITSQYARSSSPTAKAGARHHHRLASRRARKSIAPPRANGMKLQPMSSQVSCAGTLLLAVQTVCVAKLHQRNTRSPGLSRRRTVSQRATYDQPYDRTVGVGDGIAVGVGLGVGVGVGVDTAAPPRTINPCRLSTVGRLLMSGRSWK